MNRQTKRSLATMLTGLIATLAALLLAEIVRQRACTGATGTWNGAARSCSMPTDAPVPPLLAGSGAYLVAIPAAVLLGVVLWRTYTFFASGAGRRRPPE
jgi:hypothetical protein